MNRIEAVPRRRRCNYRDFSRLTEGEEPLVDFDDEPLGICQGERAARKKDPAKESKSTFAESLDAARRELRDDRRSASQRELVEAASDPIEEHFWRHAVQ
jgi:hypothetical protein